MYLELVPLLMQLPMVGVVYIIIAVIGVTVHTFMSVIASVMNSSTVPYNPTKLAQPGCAP